MPNFIIRDISTERLAALDEIARQAGKSRQQYIAAWIEEITTGFSPDIILGYTELTGGEIDPETDCPECLQPFENRGVWIGFTGSLRPFGPVCGMCANL